MLEDISTFGHDFPGLPFHPGRLDFPRRVGIGDYGISRLSSGKPGENILKILLILSNEEK